MRVMKRKLPLGVVAMLVMLVLATIGVVYGNWTQKLTINGTVSTGSVDATWIDNPVSPKCIDSEFGGPKDVAQMTQHVKADGKFLNVELTNGYPNYAADCEVTLQYTGKIPGKIERITFDPKNLTGCVVDQSPNTGSFSATCAELQVTWDDGLCTQLSSGDRLGSSLIVEVLKGAEENASYGFNVNVEMIQWDKSGC